MLVYLLLDFASGKCYVNTLSMVVLQLFNKDQLCSQIFNSDFKILRGNTFC